MLRYSSLALVIALASVASAQPPRGQPVKLPDGPGKTLVEARCTACHGLNQIANSGYTEPEWHEVFSSMVKLPSDTAAIIAGYLAKNYPSKPRIAPGLRLVSGRAFARPESVRQSHFRRTRLQRLLLTVVRRPS